MKTSHFRPAILGIAALMTFCATIAFSSPVAVPWFEIDIRLSAKAQAEIQRRGETILVVAYFGGIPKAGSKFKPDEMGNIDLGQARVELSGQGIARFEGFVVPKEKVAALTDSNYNVLVNVFTARKTDKNNLLACGIVEDSIGALQGKRHVISGKLIGEH